MNNSLLTTEIDILILLLVACFAAIALQRLQFPYTIGLVIVGLILGWLSLHVEALEIFQTLSLSHDLILFVLVPPLIFESALNLDGRLLIRNLSPIFLLAAPGLLLSTAIVGGILSWGTPLTLSQALLFGALISATDPVAVIALFKELGAPKKLTVLVEGESLFNDATAIVVFNIILASLVTGESFGQPILTQGIAQFLRSLMGGIVVGGTVGYCARSLMTLVKDNALVLFTITMVLTYGVFLLAEETVEVSGVIAVVSAGLTAGWYKSNRLPPESQASVGEFWEYLAFLANSLIFLLVGLTISQSPLFGQVSQTVSLLSTFGLTIVAILLARGVVVFGLIPLLNLTSSLIGADPIDRRYQAVSFWGGLRGAVCLALALSLEAEFPNRDLIVALTLGVVLFTLLVPGTTVGRLIRELKLDRPALGDQWGQAIAKVAAKRAALQQIEIVKGFHPCFPEVINRFQQRYQQEFTDAKQALSLLREQSDMDIRNLQLLVWLVALSMEQKSYRMLYGQGFMSEPVLDQFSAKINLFQDAVLSGDILPIRSKFMPLENLWSDYVQAIIQQVFADSDWLVGQRSHRVIAQYEYWSILIRVSDLVSLQLKEFAQQGGADFIAVIQPCLDLYRQEQIEAKEAAGKLAQQFPDLVMSHQIEISDRIAYKFQHDTIETLMAEGTLSISPDGGDFDSSLLIPKV